MHILVGVKKTHHQKGHSGLETQNKNLLEGLKEKGYQITVLAPKHELTTQTILENGISYNFIEAEYRLGKFFGLFGRQSKNNWYNKIYTSALEIHKKNPVDIVISQSSSGAGLLEKFKKLGIKTLGISHGTIESEYITFVKNVNFPSELWLYIKNTGYAFVNYLWRQREYVYGCNKVICVSNYVKNKLAEETFSPENKFIVINNGSKFEIPYAGQARKRGKKALYVGSIIKSKGVEQICNMYTNALKDYEVTFIGTGKLLDFLTNKYKNHKNITFVGQITQKEVVENYMLNPDYGVFLFPTNRIEGFPMVLAECMYAGLPPVAYNLGGVPDAIINGETGYLVKPGNYKEFVSRVHTILTNDTLRAKIGENAHMYAFNNFSYEKMIDSYDKVIKEL